MLEYLLVRRFEGEVQQVDIIFIAIPASGKFHLSANCGRTRTFVKPECQCCLQFLDCMVVESLHKTGRNGAFWRVPLTASGSLATSGMRHDLGEITAPSAQTKKANLRRLPRPNNADEIRRKKSSQRKRKRCENRLLSRKEKMKWRNFPTMLIKGRGRKLTISGKYGGRKAKEK